MNRMNRRVFVEPTWSSAVVLAAAALVIAACGGDSDSEGSGVNAAGPSLSVSWAQALSCTGGSSSDVTVTLSAVDDIDAEVDLVYSGNVSSCGVLTQKVNVVSCPQLAPYSSTATVTDRDGNSTTVNFTVAVCADGTAS